MGNSYHCRCGFQSCFHQGQGRFTCASECWHAPYSRANLRVYVCVCKGVLTSGGQWWMKGVVLKSWRAHQLCSVFPLSLRAGEAGKHLLQHRVMLCCPLTRHFWWFSLLLQYSVADKLVAWLDLFNLHTLAAWFHQGVTTSCGRVLFTLCSPCKSLLSWRGRASLMSFL